MAKIIAIDFDGTYSADPELFDVFIAKAKNHGHSVFCVTFRDAEKHGRVDIPGVEVFYTSGILKAEYMASVDLIPDIWIDDMPHLIGQAPTLLGLALNG